MMAWDRKMKPPDWTQLPCFDYQDNLRVIQQMQKDLLLDRVRELSSQNIFNVVVPEGRLVEDDVMVDLGRQIMLDLDKEWERKVVLSGRTQNRREYDLSIDNVTGIIELFEGVSQVAVDFKNRISAPPITTPQDGAVQVEFPDPTVFGERKIRR